MNAQSPALASGTPRHRESLGTDAAPFDGRYEAIALRPGMLMMIRDLVTLAAIDGEKETGPAVHVGIMLDGAGQSWVQGSDTLFSFLPGQMSLMTTSRTTLGGFHIPAGTRLRLIDIRFELAFLESLLRDVPLLTDSDILSEQILSGNGIRLTYLPLAAPAKRAAAQILAAGTTSAGERLFLESKAIELLSLALTELDGRRLSGARPRPAISLSRRDRLRLHQAHDLLIADLENPPLLRDLARLVGLNENKLKQGFRQIFGDSVYATVQRRRLEAAAALLRAGKSSVTEAALSVGYANPAHFAKLFRRHFGMAPSQYGQRGDIANESQITPDPPA